MRCHGILSHIDVMGVENYSSAQTKLSILGTESQDRVICLTLGVLNFRKFVKRLDENC